ncbi:MAG: rhomboid family intramembrane serine protease [Gammaproteobacteria bacterium]|nr:rhomboid family intramembrane serine protease [Gammaproteobacteria bacterium]MCW8987956.1 rhomboid family intramembrane serine protease [Gammaproteobacteria bacterium]
MMIPLKAELRISTKPVVTYAIVLICILIYALQANNHKEIAKSATSYCSGVNQFNSNYNELDFLSHNPATCVSWITSFYGLADKQHIPYFFKKEFDQFSRYSNKFNQDTYYESLKLFQNHMNAFSNYAPINLDGVLVYDPSTLNLVTMVTSVLSHGSFMHIFFNLVFFLAFAPALEALVGSSWRFIGVIGLMILGTNLVYALAMGSADYPTPTLGLSGIVSGMMGFAASFMPFARIRTFYYVVVLPTPVWLLSTYYIGWDIYDLYTRTDHGGVNITVHVAGGVIGVLMMYFFRNRHKEISDELHDEIEYMKTKRTTLVDDERTKTEIALQKSQYINEKKEAEFLEQLHRYARVSNHSKIINIVLSEYDPLHTTIERYEFIFDQLQQWTPGRAYECVGRLIIDLRLNHQQSGAALRIAKTLFEIKGNILLADPSHVLPFAQAAKEVNEYNLAYEIIKSNDERYWGQCSCQECILLEMELLHLYLDRTPDALALLKSVFDNREHIYRMAVISYAKQIGIIGGK